MPPWRGSRTGNRHRVAGRTLRLRATPGVYCGCRVGENGEPDTRSTQSMIPGQIRGSNSPVVNLIPHWAALRTPEGARIKVDANRPQLSRSPARGNSCRARNLSVSGHVWWGRCGTIRDWQAPRDRSRLSLPSPRSSRVKLRPGSRSIALNDGPDVPRGRRLMASRKRDVADLCRGALERPRDPFFKRIAQIALIWERMPAGIASPWASISSSTMPGSRQLTERSLHGGRAPRHGGRGPVFLLAPPGR